MSNLNWKNDPRRSPVMTVTEVVAANVHRLRKRRGWTQDQLRQQLAETGVRLSRPTVVPRDSATPPVVSTCRDRDHRRR